MATELTLPELGEGIDSAEVVTVLVSVGDVVQVDQSVLEVESDKASLEVPSTVSGKVVGVHVKQGDEIQSGQVLLTVEAAEGTDDPGIPVAAESPDAGAPAVPPPATADPAAQAEEAGPAPATQTAAQGIAAPTGEGRPAVAAAPSVRKFAREVGVDLRQVTGAGPGGRISMDDVKEHARTRPAAGGDMPQAGPLPDFSNYGEIEIERMGNVRRTTAEHTASSWVNIPHVTLFNNADITELENLRKQYKARVESQGGKLTITSILLKVCASALKLFPRLNASVDVANRQVILKHYYHIGVAADTKRGLVVPVVREVDRKNILELSVELAAISDKARSGKLGIEDLQGGTFTITNLGLLGTTHFTPIVNQPEVAILGVGRASVEPVYVDAEFSPRLMLPLSLSFDHRLVDGADGARFLQWILEALEQPLLLSLEG